MTKSAFVVCAICFSETVDGKWYLHKTVRQTESSLEGGFVKHWLNSD